MKFGIKGLIEFEFKPKEEYKTEYKTTAKTNKARCFRCNRIINKYETKTIKQNRSFCFNCLN